MQIPLKLVKHDFPIKLAIFFYPFLAGLEHPPPINLVGGQSNTEGRVEIFVDGQWGTICDDYWGYTDAEVVCRQLGLPVSGAQALSYAHFGQGEGPIILDNVHCTGNEAYISDCQNNGLFIHNCEHYEDAGVRCQGKCVCV